MTKEGVLPDSDPLADQMGIAVDKLLTPAPIRLIREVKNIYFQSVSDEFARGIEEEFIPFNSSEGKKLFEELKSFASEVISF